MLGEGFRQGGDGIHQLLTQIVPLGCDGHLGVMLLLTVPPLVNGKLRRWQGILLLCIYAAYCAIQFTM